MYICIYSLLWQQRHNRLLHFYYLYSHTHDYFCEKGVVHPKRLCTHTHTHDRFCEKGVHIRYRTPLLPWSSGFMCVCLGGTIYIYIYIFVYVYRGGKRILVVIGPVVIDPDFKVSVACWAANSSSEGDTGVEQKNVMVRMDVGKQNVHMKVCTVSTTLCTNVCLYYTSHVYVERQKRETKHAAIVLNCNCPYQVATFLAPNVLVVWFVLTISSQAGTMRGNRRIILHW